MPKDPQPPVYDRQRRSPEEDKFLGVERLTPEQEKAAEAKAAEEREVRRQFLTGQLGNPLFRTWLMEILTGFGTFENSFGLGPTGFPDHEATQFKLGMKAAGWHLWEMFDNASPEQASLMRREAAGLV
jgi:hypothetical protein